MDQANQSKEMAKIAYHALSDKTKKEKTSRSSISQGSLFSRTILS